MKPTPVLLVISVLCGTASATTWGPSEKTDPLTGRKVACHEIGSFGGYIYDWPSKHDMIFWPLTDENWICMNPETGYAAFNEDFEELSDVEKTTLAAWLPKHFQPAQPPTSHEEKLAWLEKVYGQREMDVDFWSRFYRLMAYVHRENHATSMDYVKKAMPLLKEQLATNPEGLARLETLYVLGEYHERLGEKEKAERFLSQVRLGRYVDEEGKEQVGHPYFIKLLGDRGKLSAEELSAEQDAGGRVRLWLIVVGVLLLGILWMALRARSNRETR